VLVWSVVSRGFCLLLVHTREFIALSMGVGMVAICVMETCGLS